MTWLCSSIRTGGDGTTGYVRFPWSRWWLSGEFVVPDWGRKRWFASWSRENLHLEVPFSGGRIYCPISG